MFGSRKNKILKTAMRPGFDQLTKYALVKFSSYQTRPEIHDKKKKSIKQLEKCVRHFDVEQIFG